MVYSDVNEIAVLEVSDLSLQYLTLSTWVWGPFSSVKCPRIFDTCSDAFHLSLTKILLHGAGKWGRLLVASAKSQKEIRTIESQAQHATIQNLMDELRK